MKKDLKVAELSPLDKMLSEASANEASKKTLSEAEAIKLVDELYAKVSSKNAMLKLIRSLGYSISMNRLFKIYIDYTKLINKTKDKA